MARSSCWSFSGSHALPRTTVLLLSGTLTSAKETTDASSDSANQRDLDGRDRRDRNLNARRAAAAAAGQRREPGAGLHGHTGAARREQEGGDAVLPRAGRRTSGTRRPELQTAQPGVQETVGGRQDQRL